MDWIIITIIILAITFFIIQQLKSKDKKNTDEYPYEKRKALFTIAERSFLGVLNIAIKDDAQIFGQVRVADIITTKKGLTASIRQTALNKIQSKHFDFILCNKNDLSILCAIELNDSSHNSQKRKDRDNFLKNACKSAGLPLIEIKAKKNYRSEEIRSLIEKHISKEQKKAS